jgi:shikimate dehydrogenase
VHEIPTRLVLLGHPVGHSLSPTFQNAALKSAGLNATYDALDVTPEALPGVLRELARAGVAGNVTIPHKEAMAAACAHTTELATRVGAVNTFWHEKGKLVGDNTDVAGARAAIAAVLEAARSGRQAAEGEHAEETLPLRVALLGAGGAAAAVLVALESFAPASITLWTRTPERAHALATRLGVTIAVAESAELAVREADIVINCTPIGLQHDELPVEVAALPRAACVLDLVPKRGDTAWVRECRAGGHVAEDGLRMLIEQGAAAFERWFDMVPDRASMWRSLGARSELSAGIRVRPAGNS